MFETLLASVLCRRPVAERRLTDDCVTKANFPAKLALQWEQDEGHARGWNSSEGVRRKEARSAHIPSSPSIVGNGTLAASDRWHGGNPKRPAAVSVSLHCAGTGRRRNDKNHRHGSEMRAREADEKRCREQAETGLVVVGL